MGPKKVGNAVFCAFLGLSLATAVSARAEENQELPNEPGESVQKQSEATKTSTEEPNSASERTEEEEEKSIGKSAEHDHKGKRHWFFSPNISSIFFVAGIDFLNTDNLNDRLDKAGFNKTKNPYLTLGGQVNLRFGRMIVGGEVHWLKNFSGEADSGDIRFSRKEWYGLLNLGIDAVAYKGLSIYPMVGIGMGESRLKIAEEPGATFNEILDDPGREVTLTQRGLLLDASLGIDYRFTVRERERFTSYFTVGLRGGYLFAPYSGQWEMSAGEVSRGPEFGISGPYVQLMIGFSGKKVR